MSKSIRNRHNNSGVFIKNGGDSDKKDKRVANRKFRRCTRIHLSQLDDAKIPQSIRDVSDTWNFRSDGLAMYVKRYSSSRYRYSFEDDEWQKYKSK